MCDRRHRGAFTLLELLVVMGILAALFALTAVYFATFGKSQTVQNGVDQFSGWLVSARQLAKRDGLPTGLRFFVDPNNKTFITQVQYIQQPDDFAVGTYVGSLQASVGGPFSIARIQSQMVTVNANGTQMYPIGDPSLPNTFVNLTDQKVFPVQAGDFLEIYGSGVLRRIINAPKTSPANPVLYEDNSATKGPWGVYQLWLDASPNAVPLPPAPPPNPINNLAATNLPWATDSAGNVYYELRAPNYRIIPAPRPINGEPLLNLPDNVVIDISAMPWNMPYAPSGPSGPGSLSNPPGPRGLDAAGNPYYEILFSPTGAVVGQGTTGQIFFWVRTVPADNTVDRFAGRPVLVTVQTQSGSVAQHQVLKTADPYSFAKDGLSSGM